ncbi:selenium-dependent xanthine dehydrogenase [Clostridium botulinum]|uniref:Selenium-dependent molybdenum hydroxylase 1 n=1 Tax=Clostridium botulinum (strain Eklund 17B / Type B) TaxID=935198 RepID=B2TKN2_CLOBB|nr:selenium-dependent xanthine dehydrogenase [Clostridium sp. ZBS20]ACD22604.1 selenium-dependent molybdenum hydroxylase 1 [Clostridium botulinum B str. Eklund 17B (NRP)]MBY6976508.1 selenium-dependent xanthine dehydrogenase [Clostridium botulinum]MBY7001559.1 selenium-dependent xanthine dehydrogenase [Clostridium botulinum]MCR1274396.1 selenium-dependent xanthine dehydrogenase [Clostridium botulinum]NFD69073.1 selenium-dependent xanthine dehydrogenase [Clostridium botulinum]
MFKFILNGQEKSVDENKKLLKYLRDDCNITSVKNGCSEGACGTCMVIVDGKAIKACVLTTEKVNGKTITTIEGFTDREREVFAYAFTEAGAVQCGFCIPGMVISAKALFNRTLEPTMEDVKKALIGNICRCTGYVKIEKAIMMAAEIFRKNKEVPKVSCKGLIGEPMARVDARDKTLGLGEYTDDIRIEGMVYGAALRSKYPRALVKSMDITEAENLKGVIKIVTAEDIPGQRYLGHLKKDTPALIKVGEETRYLGDAVALVAAETEEIAKEALKYIKVDFEELKPLSSPMEALKDDAPKIHEGGNVLVHEHLVRGNADEAIKKSKYVVTNKYSVPFTEHAFLEPEAAVAVPDGEDGLIVYTGTQSIYDDLREIGSLLNLGEDKLRIISEYVGGGFGGKEDMSCQHHTALLAYLIKKPVKMCLTRQESIMVDTKRHAMEMEFTTACDENGKLTAMKAEIIADTGAYASLGGPVLQRACTHAAGPYNYQNMVVDGIAVYTNNTPGGAFRGFGVTQSAFATECNLNQLAEMVGIDPFEIRMLNAIRPGEVLANGQIADEGTALVETLEAVKDSYYSNKYAGIACTFKNAGVGVGIPDTGRCKVKVIDGKVHIRTSAACIGQGVGTVVVQVVGEILGIPASQIVYETPDTRITPNSGTTTASRQTVFTGEATRIASLKLKEALKGKSLQELEGIEFLGEYIGITDKMGSPKENPVSHVAYGFATQVVIIDEKGKLVKVVAAHDVGKAINPKNVEGQIEGGVVMGLGYGLTEDYIIENSVPKVKFGTLGLLRATQVPEIVPIIIEKNTQELSFGAKGVGEITCIPTAPAVQGAYYKLDGIFRRELPLKNTFYKKIKK